MKKILLSFLCAAFTVALSLPAHADVKPVLLVLTSHGELGDTGKKTGFFLSELTHPLEVFEKAGFAVEMASIEGGQPPVDGLDLQDAVNARYWNDSAFRAKLSATKKLSSLDPKGFSAVFFAGGHGTMWDFPDDKAVQKTIREIYQGGRPHESCSFPARIEVGRAGGKAPSGSGFPEAGGGQQPARNRPKSRICRWRGAKNGRFAQESTKITLIPLRSPLACLCTL